MDTTSTVPALQLLIIASSAALPLLIGLVTTRVTPAGTKAVLLATLALASQLVGELIVSMKDGTSYDVGVCLSVGLGS